MSKINTAIDVVLDQIDILKKKTLSRMDLYPVGKGNCNNEKRSYFLNLKTGEVTYWVNSSEGTCYENIAVTECDLVTIVKPSALGKYAKAQPLALKYWIEIINQKGI